MQKKIKIKAVGKYNGHSIKVNKSVDISFKFVYSEMTNCVQFLQLMNENITVFAKPQGEKPKELGIFMIKEVKFDHDGECVVKFNSSLDYIEPSNLDGLIGDLLQMQFTASIELEEEEDDDEDN